MQERAVPVIAAHIWAGAGAGHLSLALCRLGARVTSTEAKCKEVPERLAMACLAVGGVEEIASGVASVYAAPRAEHRLLQRFSHECVSWMSESTGRLTHPHSRQRAPGESACKCWGCVEQLRRSLGRQLGHTPALNEWTDVDRFLPCLWSMPAGFFLPHSRTPAHRHSTARRRPVRRRCAWWSWNGEARICACAPTRLAVRIAAQDEESDVCLQG